MTVVHNQSPFPRAVGHKSPHHEMRLSSLLGRQLFEVTRGQPPRQLRLGPQLLRRGQDVALSAVTGRPARSGNLHLVKESADDPPRGSQCSPLLDRPPGRHKGASGRFAGWLLSADGAGVPTTGRGVLVRGTRGRGQIPRGRPKSLTPWRRHRRRRRRRPHHRFSRHPSCPFLGPWDRWDLCSGWRARGRASWDPADGAGTRVPRPRP